VHVKDDDMAIPPNWKTDPTAKSPLGHQDDGRTVAIHSLAVLPAYQHKGFGSRLLKAYIQRIKSSGVADRIAIITYDRLVAYYEHFGFKNEGESAVVFGGAKWYDMVNFPQPSPMERYKLTLPLTT
jgi:GNAT superfamily N-acetyltransferase